MEKLFHGHINIISLVTVKMLFIFLLIKLATIFILDKLTILDKELQNRNQMSKTRITALAGYAQNILEGATKPSHIFKYFHSIMKQILRSVNIKKKDIFLDGNLY